MASQEAASDKISQNSTIVQNDLPHLTHKNLEGSLWSPPDVGNAPMVSQPHAQETDETTTWVRIDPGNFCSPAPTTSTVGVLQGNARAASPFVLGGPSGKAPTAAANK